MMSRIPDEKCDVCGAEGHTFDIEIFHRSCRFKAAIPDAYTRKDGLLFFDPVKMKEHLEKTKDD